MNESTRKHLRRRFLASLVALCAVTAIVLPRPSMTEAAWTDPEYGAGGFTAGSVGNVASLSCSTSGIIVFKSLVLNWPVAVNNTVPVTGYVIEFWRAGVLEATTNTTTNSLTIGSGLLGGLLNAGTYTIFIRPLNSTVGWTGTVASPAQPSHVDLLLGWACTP